MSSPLGGALAPPAGATSRAGLGVRPTVEAVSREVAVHAHAWLLAGSAAGVLLAALLVSPRLGDLLAPLTYGRWAALHLDLTLYGWLGVPLLGLLFRAYRLHLRPALATIALAAWSGALTVGAASWLVGETSGKLFVDWTGSAAHVFTAAQLATAAVLAAGAWSAYREERANGSPSAAKKRWVGRLAGVAALVTVPVALEIAERPDLYPHIDPASGGPTAASLLVSTLALVALVLATPRLARRPVVRARGAAIAPVALAVHAAIWAAAPTGDRDNEPGQLLLLATVAIWAVLLPYDLRRYDWPPSALPWMRAAAVWGLLLLISGVAQFAPPLLAQWKFTHGLVAHAHIATAGFASAIAAVLLRLGEPLPVGDERFERSTFWLWNAGLAAHVSALVAMGAVEAGDPAALLRGGLLVTALLVARGLAGVAMAVAAARWLSTLVGGRR